MLSSQGIATILRLYYILGRIATLAREQQYHKRKMKIYFFLSRILKKIATITFLIKIVYF